MTDAVDPGFQIIPGVFSPAELEPLCRLVQTTSRGRAGARHLLGHADVRGLAEDERLTQIASSMLSSTARCFKATLFDKSPMSNWLVTWHQDLALPLVNHVDAPGWGPWSRKGGRLYALAPANVLAHVVALRVHLDDSRADNGPLRVLPGTHRYGRLTDVVIADLAHSTPSVDCLVPAGGVVAMRPLVVHASSKSTSALPRRVLHLEYATGGALGPGIELAVA